MFLVAFFLALRERSGRRQPPAERSPCISQKQVEFVSTNINRVARGVGVLFT